jgi:sporulation protein YlmC with PRC-barrel domain
MMNASKLKGLAVVSLQEGTKLGQVEQPLFDLAGRELGALRVKGDSGTFILPFAQIVNVGNDAITVTSSKVTQTPSTGGATDALLDLQALEKLKIVDQTGTFLGTLSNVEVDPSSGKITRLAAHEGGVFGMGGTTTPIEPDAIVMVGSDLLTVTTQAESPAPASSQDLADTEGTAAHERWTDDGGDGRKGDPERR